ncbi:hypothetical protein TEMA_03200 [Terrisporobacter mayombei]|uniref:Uncharacterized protein n=2 Tax=Terrisporobacter mayombei TaxID=1541 RepID=A0ABY9PWJ3_9FIRM|nr:hypothetical protein TEMA_03200 [Terrisporobacter mayombei]
MMLDLKNCMIKYLINRSNSNMKKIIARCKMVANHTMKSVGT